MSAKVIASAFAVVAILTAQQTGTKIPETGTARHGTVFGEALLHVPQAG